MNNTNDFSELKEFINNSYNNNKLKRKRRKTIVIIMINILSISLLVGGGIGIKSIMDYKEDYKKAQKTQEDLQTLKENIKVPIVDKQEIIEKPIIDPEVTMLFNSLLEENPDTVGWLKVKGADIDMPIVKSSDNTYYLTHNFDKKWNSMGWAFADYRNTFPNLNQNTIIYGHTYVKSMIFTSLSNVLKEDWYNNSSNHIIKFITSEKVLYFKIFSIYTTKVTEDYLQTSFNHDQYINFIDTVTSRSKYDFNEEVKFNDRILTLSTCYNNSNYRLVVHARLMDQELEDINYEE